MSVTDLCLPIALAYVGKCCTCCCASANRIGDGKLLRCASCKLVCYCSKDCQKADWSTHKVECKLLNFLKTYYSSIPIPDSYRQNKVLGLFEALPLLADGPDKNLPTRAQLDKLNNQHNNKVRFTKFVTNGRACSICLKNDFCDAPPPNKIDWQCCTDCNFGWCCSPEHWEEYKDKHTPDICTLYQDSCKIELFHYYQKTSNDLFIKMPRYGLTEAMKHFPENWDAYFRTRFPETYPHDMPTLPPEFFPAATQQLSPPITCLHAMYKFGISHFVNDKEGGGDLTIHVVGAASYELPATKVWEEISHCLPEVKTLTIQFVGPNAFKGKSKEHTIINSVCPECSTLGRQRIFGMFAYTYHDFEREYLATSKHSKPDLIVAFNTGMHEEETDSWKTSLKVILDMNVPAYFTSYCEYEAVKDFELLQSMNANILQKGPERNAFGEQHMQIEATIDDRVDEFFANNMYGVLFQGKKAYVSY